MTLEPKKKKKAKRIKYKWCTARGDVWAYDPPHDVEMHNGQPVRYSTPEESQKLLDDLERARWERVERIDREREERQKRMRAHAARVEKEIPKLDKMTLKQLKAYVKKNGPIDLEFDLDRWDAYRTPENIIAARKLGFDVKSAGYYFGKKASATENQKYSKKYYAHRQAALNSMTAAERREANAAIGKVKFKDRHLDQTYEFDAIDYLNEEEMKKLTSIRVTWDRDYYVYNKMYRNRGRAALVLMSPNEYLRHAHTLHKSLTDDTSLASIRDGVREGNVFDTPWLEVGPDGKITGEHEGRHRATVFKEMGIKKIPVLIYYDGDRTRGKEWENIDAVYDNYYKDYGR